MSSTPVSVREVTVDDLARLEAIATRPELGLVTVSFEAQGQGEAVYALAERGEDVLGSGVLDLREQEQQPELKLLYVTKKHRREGVGSAISEFLEDVARKRGFTECFMAVDPNNEKMIPLVVDLGYSATGDHRFVENPDAEQVDHPSQVSNYYALYRKSLTMR